MKKLLIIIAACFLSQVAKSQVERKNSVYADFAGPIVAGIGVSYERYFPLNDKINFTARTGGGLVKSFTQFSPYIGGSFSYGKRSALEIGANQIFNYDPEAFMAPEEVGPHDGEEAFQLLMGYRYKNENSGVMFRVFLVPPIGKFVNWLGLPSGGVSIGYAF